ncbi:hypothetical protein E2C01_051226 [Portunus trituberculatus]|uniref:Uncharacterized protein n=1 Tax=Portunus trituberculatus TaxID=210409 RepID=A0A5B7GJP9_PORTR|nr:hypothetical protein [Portunus trituberculatus]
MSFRAGQSTGKSSEALVLLFPSLADFGHYDLSPCDSCRFLVPIYLPFRAPLAPVLDFDQREYYV